MWEIDCKITKQVIESGYLKVLQNWGVSHMGVITNWVRDLEVRKWLEISRQLLIEKIWIKNAGRMKEVVMGRVCVHNKMTLARSGNWVHILYLIDLYHSASKYTIALRKLNHNLFLVYLCYSTIIFPSIKVIKPTISMTQNINRLPVCWKS